MRPPVLGAAAGNRSTALAASTSDQPKPPISTRRRPVRMRSRTTAPYSLSLPSARQTSPSSSSLSTRSRGLVSANLFNPVAGLLSVSPSRMAQEKNADKDERAMSAAVGALAAISPRRTAIAWRLIEPMGRPWNGLKWWSRYRSVST